MRKFLHDHTPLLRDHTPVKNHIDAKTDSILSLRSLFSTKVPECTFTEFGKNLGEGGGALAPLAALLSTPLVNVCLKSFFYEIIIL